MNPPLIKSSVVTILLTLCGIAHGDIVVVGNMDAPELSAEMVKQIFLKKTDILPNGIHAIPIDLTDNNETKWLFYKKVTSKKPDEVYSYWTRVVLSGNGNPPEQVKTASELKRRLDLAAGTIGYIDEKDIKPGMKVLLRLAI